MDGLFDGVRVYQLSVKSVEGFIEELLSLLQYDSAPGFDPSQVWWQPEESWVINLDAWLQLALLGRIHY